MKRCPKCSKEKPFIEFYKNKRQSDGLSVWCKVCTNNDTSNRAKNNPEKEKSRRKKYYKANKEKIDSKTSVWVKNNRDKRRVIESKYRKANKGKRIVWEQNRRAIKLGLNPNFPSDAREILIDFYGEICANPDCTKEINEQNPITLDHVIPISHPETRHDLDNIQLLCLSCNSSKGNRKVIDYRNKIYEN